MQVGDFAMSLHAPGSNSTPPLDHDFKQLAALAQST
jgi:hypothetical protein